MSIVDGLLVAMLAVYVGEFIIRRLIDLYIEMKNKLNK